MTRSWPSGQEEHGVRSVRSRGGSRRRIAATAGRDIKTITTSVFGAAPDAALLDTWAAAGVYRTILRLPSEGRDKILPMLDQWAKLIKK